MSNGHRNNTTVLALHGFTLCGAMFTDVAARLDAGVEAPDLPGHGGRDMTNTSWDAAVAEVVAVARATSPDVIVGYSMGGRLALNATLKAADVARRLVLISTSLGIEDPTKRHQRYTEDAAAADRITDDRSAEEYLRSFHLNPMVQAERATIDLESLRLGMNRIGLAGALRGMGQGAQPFVGHRLADLTMPVTWMTGSEDEKYSTIARHAHTACPHGSLAIVPDSGHNVVAERPDAVAAAITAILSE